MELNKEDKEKILQAGKIASEARAYARTIIKRGVPVLEIAEKIEEKIEQLGARPAFPVNLSINSIAAHYTPSHDDKTLAHGLLKVDLGVHIDGWVADTSFSLDLESNEENQKLIKASEEALDAALHLVKSRINVDNKKDAVNIKNTSSRAGSLGKGKDNVDDLKLSEIGAIIEKTINSHGFNPITNLSGHSIEHYDLHSGVTIPNIDNKSNLKLKEGLYAIEPFATTGNGKVHDGQKSNIYHLINEKNPRSQIAREVLSFILREYNTLPFCSRWIIKNLGPRALIGLRELEANGNLHHYAQLVETSNAGGTKVSQSEHTILVEKNKITITTI